MDDSLFERRPCPAPSITTLVVLVFLVEELCLKDAEHVIIFLDYYLSLSKVQNFCGYLLGLVTLVKQSQRQVLRLKFDKKKRG